MRAIFDVPVPSFASKIVENETVLGTDSDGNEIHDFDIVDDEEFILAEDFNKIPVNCCIKCKKQRAAWTERTEYFQAFHYVINRYTEPSGYCEACVKAMVKGREDPDLIPESPHITESFETHTFNFDGHHAGRITKWSDGHIEEHF